MVVFLPEDPVIDSLSLGSGHCFKLFGVDARFSGSDEVFQNNRI